MSKFDETTFAGEQTGTDKPRDDQVNNAQTQSQQVRQNLSEEELKMITDPPGVLCSRFYFAMQDQSVVKIVFADESADKKFVAPRFACVMSLSSFLSFAQIVQNAHNQIAQKLMQTQGMAGLQVAPNIPHPADREKLD